MQLSLGLNTHQLFLQEHAGLALQYFLGVQAETALYPLLVSLYHVHVNSTELTNLPGGRIYTIMSNFLYVYYSSGYAAIKLYLQKFAGITISFSLNFFSGFGVTNVFLLCTVSVNDCYLWTDNQLYCCLQLIVLTGSSPHQIYPPV